MSLRAMLSKVFRVFLVISVLGLLTQRISQTNLIAEHQGTA